MSRAVFVTRSGDGTREARRRCGTRHPGALGGRLGAGCCYIGRCVGIIGRFEFLDLCCAWRMIWMRSASFWRISTIAVDASVCDPKPRRAWKAYRRDPGRIKPANTAVPKCSARLVVEVRSPQPRPLLVHPAICFATAHSTVSPYSLGCL